MTYPPAAGAGMPEPIWAEGIGGTGMQEPIVDTELGSWMQCVKEAVFYARVIARSKGYALALHGTLRRDVDMVAVPWTDEACDADELAQSIAESLFRYGVCYETAWEGASKTREEKPHGRIAWSIPLKWTYCTGAAPYLDLSVVSRAASPSGARTPEMPIRPILKSPPLGTLIEGNADPATAKLLGKLSQDHKALLEYTEALESHIAEIAVAPLSGDPEQHPAIRRLAWLEAHGSYVSRQDGGISEWEAKDLRVNGEGYGDTASEAMDEAMKLAGDIPPLSGDGTREANIDTRIDRMIDSEPIQTMMVNACVGTQAVDWLTERDESMKEKVFRFTGTELRAFVREFVSAALSPAEPRTAEDLDPATRASVERGLQDARAGRVVSLGSFADAAAPRTGEPDWDAQESETCAAKNCGWYRQVVVLRQRIKELSAPREGTRDTEDINAR